MDKELKIFLEYNGATENHKKILEALGIETLENFKYLIENNSGHIVAVSSIKEAREFRDMAQNLTVKERDRNEQATIDDIVEFFNLSLNHASTLKHHFASVPDIAAASHSYVARLLFDATYKTYDFDPDSLRRKAKEIVDWCRDDVKAYGRQLRERK